MNIIRSLVLLSLISAPAFTMEKQAFEWQMLGEPEEEKLFDEAVEVFKLKLSIKADSCVAAIRSVTQLGGACSFFYDKELGFERDVLVAVDRIKKLQEYWKSNGIKNQFDVYSNEYVKISKKNKYMNYCIQQGIAQSMKEENFTEQRLHVFQVAIARVRVEEKQRKAQFPTKYTVQPKAKL